MYVDRSGGGGGGRLPSLTYYILVGKRPVPAPLRTWGRWFEGKPRKPSKRRVAETWLPSKIRVSSVFLGIDHSFGRGSAQLFETMTFEGLRDVECYRAATWGECLRHHQRAVKRARGMRKRSER